MLVGCVKDERQGRDNFDIENFWDWSVCHLIPVFLPVRLRRAFLLQRSWTVMFHVWLVKKRVFCRLLHCFCSSACSNLYFFLFYLVILVIFICSVFFPYEESEVICRFTLSREELSCHWLRCFNPPMYSLEKCRLLHSGGWHRLVTHFLPSFVTPTINNWYSKFAAIILCRNCLSTY